MWGGFWQAVGSGVGSDPGWGVQGTVVRGLVGAEGAGMCGWMGGGEEGHLGRAGHLLSLPSLHAPCPVSWTPPTPSPPAPVQLPAVSRAFLSSQRPGVVSYCDPDQGSHPQGSEMESNSLKVTVQVTEGPDQPRSCDSSSTSSQPPWENSQYPLFLNPFSDAQGYVSTVTAEASVCPGFLAVV